MQYKNPANRELVLEGLKMTGRMDLVGYGTKCLIRPIREGQSIREMMAAKRIMAVVTAEIQEEV